MTMILFNKIGHSEALQNILYFLKNGELHIGYLLNIFHSVNVVECQRAVLNNFQGYVFGVFCQGSHNS